MISFLDDSKVVATPISMFSRKEFVEHIKSIHVDLIKASIQNSTISHDEISLAQLRRYALWLDETVLSGRLGPDESESAIALAANIFEFIGNSSTQAERISIFDPPVNDLLRSAVLGSLSPYKANSSLLSSRILDKLSSQDDYTESDRFHSHIAKIIVSVIARLFQQAFHLSTNLQELGLIALNELQADDSTNQDYLELDRALAMGLACRKLASGMLIGSPSIVSETRDLFVTIKDSALQSDDSEHFWLAKRLHDVAESMFDSSMHRILGSYDVPVPFRRALAADGIYELWRPQRKAINIGVLDGDEGKHLVVSIPTGAGKTLIAELAIVGMFKKKRPTWGIYITPSRSLVGQVSSDLRRRLGSIGIKVKNVVAGAEANMFVSDEIDLISEHNSLTVMTPEKLEAYLRVNPEIFQTCRIMICDEIHKISDPSRGALYESLVTRFRLLYPETRLILLSGVMSNSEELAAWLGQENTATLVEARRPTRQIRGLAVRHDDEPGNPRTRNGVERRRVDFKGGVLLVHEEDDLQGDLEVQLTSLFRGYFTEERGRKGWAENREAAKSSNLDHALGLTAALQASPGTILVFVGQTDWAELCCKRCSYNGTGEFSAGRQRLARHIAKELGEDHLLVESVIRGVAFHHARLPISVLRALEYALENGWLKIVFATPTLREGLNTAATNVILVGNSYFDETAEKSLPIQESDFENIAGRAGRPGRETEGRIFLVPDRMARAKAIAAGRKYILVGEEALRARSQLARLQALFSAPQHEIRNLPGPDQSLLMGLRAVGLQERDRVTDFFSHSLWSMQAEDLDEVEETARAAAGALERAEKDAGPEQFLVAARTGLALTSVEVLRTELLQHVEKFGGDGATIVDWRQSLLPKLVEIALMAPEAAKVLENAKGDWSAHWPVVSAWMSTSTYEDILNSGKDSGAFLPSHTVGRAVKYCSEVSTWLSWVFGACYTILESEVAIVDPLLGVLPLLCKYGVSSASAAYISLLGIQDRSLAQMLGDRFDQTGLDVTISNVGTWLDEIEPHLDRFIRPEELTHDLVRRQWSRRRRTRFPYRYTSVQYVRGVSPGDLISLRQTRSGPRLVDELGETIGSASSEDMNGWLGRADPTEIAGVVVDPGERNRLGTAAFVWQPRRRSAEVQ